MDIYKHLTYSKREDYGEWADFMSLEWLVAFDAFCFFWGDDVVISTHPDALGRRTGSEDKSRHNVDMYGEVRAGDFFPKGMDTKQDRNRAFECAKKAGFTGIGLYVDTSPSDMMHGDVREIKRVATWSRVDHEYFGIDRVL